MTVRYIEILPKCTGCGVCISRCAEKALEFHTDSTNRKRVRCIDIRCTGCIKCIPACRFSAIIKHITKTISQ
jgi:ferredoxin